MNITFKELRNIKHALPTGSISKIAQNLHLEEQTVRNFFGAKKNPGSPATWHLQSGPEGGILSINDTTILDFAKKLIEEAGSLLHFQIKIFCQGDIIFGVMISFFKLNNQFTCLQFFWFFFELQK